MAANASRARARVERIIAVRLYDCTRNRFPSARISPFNRIIIEGFVHSLYTRTAQVPRTQTNIVKTSPKTPNPPKNCTLLFAMIPSTSPNILTFFARNP